jgi:Integrase core domain
MGVTAISLVCSGFVLLASDPIIVGRSTMCRSPSTCAGVGFRSFQRDDRRVPCVGANRLGRSCAAERLIESIRRECTDHIIVLGEVHLRRVLKSYATYYNAARTHRSLNKDSPVSRRVHRTGHHRIWSLADCTTNIPESEFRYR